MKGLDRDAAAREARDWGLRRRRRRANRILRDLPARPRAALQADLPGRRRADAAWMQAARSRREVAAWARKLRRCPNPAPFSASLGHRVFRWARGRWRIGISAVRSRYSHPTCRWGRLGNNRRGPAPTGFPKCVREWALSEKTGGGSGGGAGSSSFWWWPMVSSVAAACGNIAPGARRDAHARMNGRRCGSARCARWISGGACGRPSWRNARMPGPWIGASVMRQAKRRAGSPRGPAKMPPRPRTTRQI